MDIKEIETSCWKYFICWNTRSRGEFKNFFYVKISLGWINRQGQLSKYYYNLLLHWQQITCRYNKFYLKADRNTIASGYLYN